MIYNFPMRLIFAMTTKSISEKLRVLIVRVTCAQHLCAIISVFSVDS